jgi:hypothetical protein
MGIKVIARPTNKAKNLFIEWLKKRDATDIEVYEGVPSNEWDYYRHVSAFVGRTLYSVYFTVWEGVVKIDYSDEENKYEGMSAEDFLRLID